MYGQGLIPRLFATLTDLAFQIEQMNSFLKQLTGPVGKVECSGDSGVGMVVVEATGGKLVQQVEIEQGCIGKLKMVAPSRWNFHRQGALTQMLTSLKFSDDLDLYCRLIIGSLDPCVDYELSIS